MQSAREQDHEYLGLGLAIGFAVLAGAVDACGYMRLHNRFVSFMSGNTTTMGVALGHGHAAEAVGIAALILLFVAGAALGAALPILTGWRPLAIVSSGVALLLVVPALWPSLTVLSIPPAMGALNAAMHRAGSVQVSLTYVTGTLVRFGQGLGARLCGERNGWSWLLQLLPWFGMLAGGTSAGLMQARYGEQIFWPVTAFAAIMAGGAWLLPQPDRGTSR